MKMFRFVLGSAFAVLALAVMGLAQTGSIQGTVSDKSGAIIPGADVNIVNLDTGIVHASKTNSTGAFNVTNLAVGRYSIEIKASGFKGFRVDEAVLSVDQVLTANVRGPFATIRAFVPLLRESGDGVIVNISSGAAQSGTGSSIIYGASKAALNTMSMALARVLGPEIRVVVVAPGMVHTGFVPGRTEEMMAKAAMATPLKRAIEAEDVALAVISCVTHLTHTTGSILAVDAGRHL